MIAPANDASTRVVLITGASRGIGRAAALAFARSGAHVVALARTQGALEELDDEIRAAPPVRRGPATLAPLDLRDHAAIDRLGEAIYRRWGRLDAFVGNAGTLGVLSPLHHVDPKEWDDVLAVNVTANWRLIRSLDPLLRRFPRGTGRLRHLWRGEPGGFSRLLGSLRDREGCARRHRPHLRRRNGQHLEHPRHADQPWAAAHADARQSHARRGPDDPAHARRTGAENRRNLLADAGPKRESCTIFRATEYCRSAPPPSRQEAIAAAPGAGRLRSLRQASFLQSISSLFGEAWPRSGRVDAAK